MEKFDNSFNSQINKKDVVISILVPEPCTRRKSKIKVELDLSNFATRSDLKNATGVDKSKFAKMFDLASLKPKIAILYIDKLETTSVDLSQLSDVVKNEVVNKTLYDELVKKVNTLHTTGTNNLVRKADFNTKIVEIEKKILDHNHDKYITTQEFNKLTTDNFPTRLKQINLAIYIHIYIYIIYIYIYLYIYIFI